ncbi:unnamed protein product [Paramecium pentaurelia]|uniref:Uncharacterized protein n=1 Tax=Paramecium pentaurelia TaxID=43138 RepID=A0A8S1RXZ9_9CILI|nr:unnamed protein product [Paramecium pentaurelia]
MLRKISQQQQEQQLKNQSLRIGDESEFNLRKFRESIYTKMQQFGNSEQQQIYVKGTAPSITKKPTMNQSLGDIPSFDEICKKLQVRKM